MQELARSPLSHVSSHHRSSGTADTHTVILCLDIGRGTHIQVLTLVWQNASSAEMPLQGLGFAFCFTDLFAHPYFSTILSISLTSLSF